MVKEKIPTYSICNLLGKDNSLQDIVVYTLSDFLKSHENIIFPHRHTFYQLLLITKGKGRHIIDFETYDVAEGLLFCLSPSQVHTWLFDSNVEGIVINFNENYISTCLNTKVKLTDFKFFNGNHLYSAYELNKKLYLLFKNLFSSIKKEFPLESLSKNNILKTLVMQLIFSLERYLEFKNHTIVNSQSLNLYHQFEKLIEENYMSMKLPKKYAEKLFVTPNYLNAICNDVVNKTAGDVIRERILLESKRLLANSNYSISEISYKLNFDDNSYFTKFFKKYVFLTPEEFRKQILL